MNGYFFTKSIIPIQFQFFRIYHYFFQNVQKLAFWIQNTFTFEFKTDESGGRAILNLT